MRRTIMCKSRRLGILVCCLFALFFSAIAPSRSYADCGCVVGWTKAAASIAASIAAQGTELVTEIERVASDVNANSGTRKSETQALIDDFKAFLTNMQNAEAAAASQRRLASQGFNPCPGRDAASAASSGSRAAGQARETLNVATSDIGDGKFKSEEEARDKRRKVVSEGPLKEEDPQGHFLMPQDGLIKGEDAQKAQDMITLASNPYPTPKVADEESRAGAEAKLEQRIKQSRIAPVVDAMNAVKTFHDGTVQADLVKQFAEGAGIDAASVPEDGGMTSMAAFYKLLAKDGRLLNSNWHQYVIDGQLDETGLLKEMMLMDAVSLAMDFDNMEALNHFSLLLAVKTAISAERANLRIGGRMYAPGVAPVEAGGN